MEPRTKICKYRTACKTADTMTENHIVWTIDNFSLHQEEAGKYLKSSIFTSGCNDKLKWQFKIYPNGNGESEDYVSVYLRPISFESGELRTKFSIALLNANGEEENKCVATHMFLPGQQWGWCKWIKKDVLQDESMLPGDRLTLRCELMVVVSSQNTSSQTMLFKQEVPDCTWTSDMGRLLEDHSFSDVVLHVAGQDIHAHKNILALRSPVFAAMFQHSMEEKVKNHVNIVDMGYEELTEMLRYIYTGRAPNLDKMASKLLPAADKYALDRLKILCEEALSSQINITNAAHMLILADTHNARQLRWDATNFIFTHSLQIMGTDGWRSLLLQPHLVNEICQAMAYQVGPVTCIHNSNIQIKEERRAPKRSYMNVDLTA